MFYHLCVEEVVWWREPRARWSAWTGLSWWKNGMSVDLEQGLFVLIELIRGEQLWCTNSNSFDFLKKRYRMGFGTFAYDVRNDNLMDRVEGDPDPGVAQDSFKLLDGLQVGFLFADERPHLVELAFRDLKVLKQRPGDRKSMARRPTKDSQDCLLVHVRDSRCSSNTHAFC